MRLKKGYILLAALAVGLGVGAIFLAGCDEDVAGITRPEVSYLDQTFSLLVCDGNGNEFDSWDHDGAAVCTLDWNGDGTGPNRVPVTYVYDTYPLIDGVAERLSTEVAKGGDYWLWETTPWTTINVSPVIGAGSQVRSVEVKALYTYVNPPRIWFFFRWEDPTHTIQPIEGTDAGPVGGTMHYYWYQEPNMTPPSEGFNNGRQWESHEDWLALVWSTWFLRSTTDPNVIPDPATTYDWEFVETVPGFQTRGINAIPGDENAVYKTPYVNTSTAPYNQAGYPGPYCDMWFFSASRTNYTAAGGWDDSESAYLFDCYIDQGGFPYPETPSTSNPQSLDPFLTFDSGLSGIRANGGHASYPSYQAPNDPDDNAPGAYYLWNAETTTVAFSLTAPWPEEGGARIAGYLHRVPLGSASDIVGRCQWQQPNRVGYGPWEGERDPEKKSGWERLKDNEYGKDWCYTLEIMRDIGTFDKIDATEDVLLGLFAPHPGK
jgi:hypothetical protein